MDLAGLSIAIFDHVFQICVFITDTINDAANHDQDYRRLKLDFTHQKLILATFGTRFIQENIIYDLDEKWKVHIHNILQELKQLVGDYARIAIKYDEDFRKRQDIAEKWFESDIDTQQTDRKILDLYTIREPQTLMKPLKLRDRLSRKVTILEWALFDHKRLEKLVNEQSKWTENLTYVMKNLLLLHPRFSKPEGLQKLSKDAQVLGFSKITKMRLVLLDLSKGGQATMMEATSIQTLATRQGEKAPGQQFRLVNATIENSSVLIEYKIYPPATVDNFQTNLAITTNRIQFLSKLLSIGNEDDEGSNSKTYSLRCRGYFHEPTKNRFALVFDVPQGYQPMPISLYTCIKTLEKDARPSLGQRFRMAHAVGYALVEWFLVDWVHKSISSKDVFFFRKGDDKPWEFSSPYVGGFEYARPLAGISNEVYSTKEEFENNLYRHPARQGFPTEGFQKSHDIYALGVLLLEIGQWQIARQLFHSGDNSHSVTPAGIKSRLIRNAKARLGHFMGQRYKDAVLWCLGGDFGVECDDLRQTKLIAAFKEKVVDVCAEGMVLL